MNKVEYMRELERLLQNIPENERIEALTYYEEYFDDAGVENEQQVIAELGYPAKVAETIKEGLRGNMGYQNNGGYQNTGYQHIGTQNVYTGGGETKEDKIPTWAIVLIVIACIFASPMLIGAAGTAFGLIISIIASLFGCIIGFGVAGGALVVSAIVCIGVGISILITTPLAGVGLIGIGLLLAALGLLFIIATVWLCGWALPTFIKWIVGLCKKGYAKTKRHQQA